VIKNGRGEKWREREMGFIRRVKEVMENPFV